MTKPHAGSWPKSPLGLVARFDEATADMPGIERRKMFGYPAAFANGHLVTSLHRDRWIVRLPEDAQRELAALGGTPFEPMTGRPMRGYLILPVSVTADPTALQPWLARALEHVLQMPPKAKR